MSTEIRELYLSEVDKMNTERGKKFKNLAEKINNLALTKSLDVSILGSVSFGVCEKGIQPNEKESYDDHHSLKVERADEDRYLVKKGDGSLITDLNLKEEWRCAMVKRFGMEFVGISCKLIEPLNSTAYIY